MEDAIVRIYREPSIPYRNNRIAQLDLRICRATCDRLVANEESFACGGHPIEKCVVSAMGRSTRTLPTDKQAQGVDWPLLPRHTH